MRDHLGAERREAILRGFGLRVPAESSRFRRETPAPFEATVLIMLTRSPDDRFQRAADMLDVIEPIANIHKIKV